MYENTFLLLIVDSTDVELSDCIIKVELWISSAVGESSLIIIFLLDLVKFFHGKGFSEGWILI